MKVTWPAEPVILTPALLVGTLRVTPLKPTSKLYNVITQIETYKLNGKYASYLWHETVSYEELSKERPIFLEINLFEVILLHVLITKLTGWLILGDNIIILPTFMLPSVI